MSAADKTNALYSQLPAAFLSDFNIPSAEPGGFVRQFVKNELRDKKSTNVLERELEYTFVLDKHGAAAKPPKRIRKKKSFLTRKQRVELEILKLPRNGWNYSSLESIRAMWRQYMRENLELATAPRCTDAEWANFSTILSKSELIGGEVKIVRSKVPSQVGICGTIVLETKMTFQVVTKSNQLKILGKAMSVFELTVDNLRFTFFGKHLMTKPSERSVKKVKGQMWPDL